MSNITPLEREALIAILTPLASDGSKAVGIVDAIAVSRREISSDVIDQRRCAGFYVHFTSNTLLSSVQSLPHHLSVHATHPSSPAGADFILFFDQASRGIDFLEATFFDSTFPIDDLASDDHGFVIRG